MSKIEVRIKVTSDSVKSYLLALEECKQILAEEFGIEYKTRRIWASDHNYSIDMTIKKPKEKEVDKDGFPPSRE